MASKIALGGNKIAPTEKTNVIALGGNKIALGETKSKIAPPEKTNVIALVDCRKIFAGCARSL